MVYANIRCVIGICAVLAKETQKKNSGKIRKEISLFQYCSSVQFEMRIGRIHKLHLYIIVTHIMHMEKKILAGSSTRESFADDEFDNGFGV